MPEFSRLIPARWTRARSRRRVIRETALMRPASRSRITLGILDWGIGGLGFHQLLRAHFPRGRVVYWSDAGTIPYGRQPTADLARRIDVVARAMGKRGVTHLALACHAASSVLHLLRWERPGLPEITGIIEPGVGA